MNGKLAHLKGDDKLISSGAAVASEPASKALRCRRLALLVAGGSLAQNDLRVDIKKWP